ncbi:MAG: hypothetical protein J7M26_00530 [Armatimonadetes bacterium]|nr:hypothetical protein [Armatimonadota bacterium]
MSTLPSQSPTEPLAACSDPLVEMAIATLKRSVLLRRVRQVLGEEFDEVAYEAYLAAFLGFEEDEDEQPERRATPEEMRQHLDELVDGAPEELRDWIRQCGEALISEAERESQEEAA